MSRPSDPFTESLILAMSAETPATDAGYLPPVSQLLKLGAEPARRRVWPDYRLLGLQERHVPALTRMAADPALHAAEERDPAVWAPLHAWRALGQLGAAEAAAPLLALLEREHANDWVHDEIPIVLGMLGAPALPGATVLLFDEGRHEELRTCAARTIAEVGLVHPDRRDEAAAVLTKQLEDWQHQSPLMNGVLIALLVDLGEVEASLLMEAAFAADAVDLEVNGDWEDAQVSLGLIKERLTPTPMFFGPSARTAPARAPKKAKSRRKAEKQSRKRNRKKK